MTGFIPWIVALATLAFVLVPFCSKGETGRSGRVREESWHSLTQLDTDRAMGKIDDAEYEELKAHVTAPPSIWSLESVIMAARRARRLSLALEAEVLIKRARRGKINDV